jgi:4'-phosphopantetheinyl transferase
MLLYLCYMPRLERQLQLHGREVQLLAVRLEAAKATLALMYSWLAPEETARAARFRFDRHRQAYVLGRGVLRALIANYLRVVPETVNFSYGSKGKPALNKAACPLSFNVSNSGEIAVYAFTSNCEIGVDVEHRRRVVEIEPIARRFFAASEVDALLTLPQESRDDAFFNCWTRKEAYIKAVGDGLSVPLDSFEVTLRPGDPARMIALNGSEAEAARWTMHAFTPDPEYTGAIAYRDPERPLVLNSICTVDELLGQCLD